LANQSNVPNINNSPNNHSSTVTPATNVHHQNHHNSLINANQTPHYQRHDFKNRRSSSEPANEQKLLTHIQSNSTHNTTTSINQTNQTNQINSSTSTNNNSLVIDDETEIDNSGDDFIDCLHQKNIKVSKKKFKKKEFSLFCTFKNKSLQ
jgi:hypothetical protein